MTMIMKPAGGTNTHTCLTAPFPRKPG